MGCDVEVGQSVTGGQRGLRRAYELGAVTHRHHRDRMRERREEPKALERGRTILW